MSTFSRLLSSCKQAINIKKINLFKNKFKTTIQIAIFSLKVRVCKKGPPLLAQVCVNWLLMLLKLHASKSWLELGGSSIA